MLKNLAASKSSRNHESPRRIRIMSPVEMYPLKLIWIVGYESRLYRTGPGYNSGERFHTRMVGETIKNFGEFLTKKFGASIDRVIERRKTNHD